MPFTGLREVSSGIALPIVLGILSTTVRVSRFGVRSWKQLISFSMVSCFVALLVHWGLSYVDFSPSVDAAIIGISSYMGESLLDAVQVRILYEVQKTKKKRVKEILDEEDNQ